MSQYNLRAGMLVRIKEGTHDIALPESRTGLLLERHVSLIDYTDRTPVLTNVWRVQFVNGKTLMFHAMYIEVINS
jgi:hypothetical protein|tara:strand:+ start:624 stop:848 length:225 start_codon:yes stop_codon:yes gene_type:complete